MTPAIRLAVPDDLPAVLEMAETLARHPGQAAPIDAQGLRTQVFELGLSRLWVAAEPEGLVGYALVVRHADRVGGETGQEVAELFVHEWRRGAGIGARLLAAVRARAQAPVIGPENSPTGTPEAYRRTIDEERAPNRLARAG